MIEKVRTGQREREREYQGKTRDTDNKGESI